jgi:hypothetical protein
MQHGATAQETILQPWFTTGDLPCFPELVWDNKRLLLAGCVGLIRQTGIVNYKPRIEIKVCMHARAYEAREVISGVATDRK